MVEVVGPDVVAGVGAIVGLAGGTAGDPGVTGLGAAGTGLAGGMVAALTGAAGGGGGGTYLRPR